MGISGKNKSMLSYDLGLEKEGTIGLRFKCDQKYLETEQPYRTIISCPSANNGTNKLLIYVDNITEQLSLAINGTTYYTKLNVILERWHTLTITWKETSLIISLDNDSRTYQVTNNGIDITDVKTYIGCNYINNEPCFNLIGSIEMFVYNQK